MKRIVAGTISEGTKIVVKMKKKLGFIEWAMRYRQIVILITTPVSGVRVYGILHDAQTGVPLFTVRQGLVVAVYPVLQWTR